MSIEKLIIRTEFIEMKKIIYIFLIGSATMLSCTKELKIYPETEKVAQRFYRNEKEIEEAINATYGSLQFKGIYNLGMLAIGEIPGEDAYDETPANDNGEYGMLDNFTNIPQSGLIEAVWRDHYMAIQNANIVLNRIKDISFNKEELKSNRIGEMKFIRALLYFNLVRCFGDVPLVVDEVKDPQELFGQGRTEKAKVYDQIKTDLKEAIASLPTRTESNKGRATKSAAQTLMGKVELTLGNFQNAKTFLDEVISPALGQGLLDDITQVFPVANELNREIIFAVQFASGVNSNSEGTDAYRMFNPTGRVEGKMTGTKGHGVLSSKFYGLFTDQDKRKGSYVKSLVSGLAYSNKIAVPVTVVEDAGSDFVVLRYADVLLMLAEIENELGSTTSALKYLDQIRMRAGIGPYKGALTKQDIFEEIDMQRRKELVFEGHRWFDIIRRGRAALLLGLTDNNKLLLPIPASQTATDQSISQNPGYTK